MEAAKNFTQRLAKSPRDSFLATFLCLMLCPLIATFAIAPLPLRSWLSSAETFLAVACLVAGLVWVKESPYSAKIKPEGMSWYGLVAVLLQVFAAGSVLYAVIGTELGFRHPLGVEPPDATVTLTLILVASLAILAAVGMIQDCWWAFFLELGLVLLLVAAIYFAPVSSAPKPPVRHLFPELPYMKEFDALMTWIAFFSLCSWLFKRGLARFRATRGVAAPEFGGAE